MFLKWQNKNFFFFILEFLPILESIATDNIKPGLPKDS